MSPPLTQGVKITDATHEKLRLMRKATKWPHKDLMEKAINDLKEKYDKEGIAALHDSLNTGNEDGKPSARLNRSSDDADRKDCEAVEVMPDDEPTATGLRYAT